MSTPQFEIGPPDTEEMVRGLVLAWGHIAQPARDQQIARTLAQWRDQPDPTAILLVARRGGEIVGGAWAQLQPGRTVIVSPPYLIDGEPPAAADHLLDRLLSQATEARAHLAQALLEVDHGPHFDRLVGRGFRHVSDLLYMVSLASGFPDVEPPTRLELESYRESQEPRMAALVERTYEATLDCPAMNGLRAIEDVLAGYRAAGTFDPARWFFLRERERDVGCLLLADHPEHKQWELVYLGLVAEVRGRGWGIEAVRRAQFLAGRAGAKCLLLAVDAANQPAIAAYSQAGFTAWDRRSVLVRRLDQSK